MPDGVYDAIVVGSGISGGWSAKEITERGLRVLRTAFGEMLPNHDNTVTLDETKKDKWGLPVASTRWARRAWVAIQGRQFSTRTITVQTRVVIRHALAALAPAG